MSITTIDGFKVQTFYDKKEHSGGVMVHLGQSNQAGAKHPADFLWHLGSQLVSFLVVLGVPDNLTFDEVDHFFGNIGGVIGEAFQMP